MIDFSFQLKRVFSLYIEREISLTYPQWRVMKTIRYSSKNISAKEIADILGFDKVTISDIVNRLIKKGYITKKIDEKDRRRNVLRISNSAHTLCKNLMEIEKSFNQTLFSDMDQKNIDNYYLTTNELLNKLNEINRSEK